jgi:hypothetical protein
MALNISSIIESYDGTDLEQYFQGAVNDSISVKQFYNNESLYLVCNEYHLQKTDDTYRECRSFVVALKDEMLHLVAFTRESITNIEESEWESRETDIYEEVIEPV